uniref:Peptidase n=1 Tax=Thermosporothrix sp. COM3 TaxID=2490863 RepID=A0A455SHS9_9CHLR|nr:peptidase [Thermosporothrix sp. COM3]
MRKQTQSAQERFQSVLAGLDNVYHDVESLYLYLHQNPELSMQEHETATKVADWLRQAGYDVTTGVGKTGVVGLLRNGQGPTVMLRGDMDALPIKEKTNLPYASKKVVTNSEGEEVPVMHACGHDLHTSCLVGTASLLQQSLHAWRGTVMIVAQPGEETMTGAKEMLKDGLFTRFPRPDVAIAQHTNPLPVGTIGYHIGDTMTSVVNMKITIFGKGGHGSRPQNCVDPVLIAAAIVMRLQTIVAREVPPNDTAIITVGSIHSGTSYNIIPDTATLQLTVRAYTKEIREHILEAIRRIVKAEAEASHAPKEPDIEIVEFGETLHNDREPLERIVEALKPFFGEQHVMETPPMEASEDFSFFGHVPDGAGIPSAYYFLGVTNEQLYAEKGIDNVPEPHSPYYAPDREPALKAGVRALTVAALAMLGAP